MLDLAAQLLAHTRQKGSDDISEPLKTPSGLNSAHVMGFRTIKDIFRHKTPNCFCVSV